MDLVIGIAIAAAVLLAVVAYFTLERRAAGRAERDSDGVERLDTTGPDSGGQRQGGHVNPYTPPIRQDGINNTGGF
jgi:predicted LPLAT superfamily acyltransferase